MRGFARCNRCPLLLALLNVLCRPLGKVGRQIADQSAPQFAGQLGVGLGIGSHLAFPGLFTRCAFRFCIPARIHFVGHMERLIRPADCSARRRHFIGPKGSTVASLSSLLVGGALADNGLAADQGGLACLVPGSFYCRLHLGRAVAIDVVNHLPAVSLESRRGIVGKPTFNVAVDGDSIVVIKGYQFAQAQCARQRADLVGNAFHQAAVPEEGISVVVDNIVTCTVKLGRQHLFRQRHTH